jgi:hypothetical protein
MNMKNREGRFRRKGFVRKKNFFKPFFEPLCVIFNPHSTFFCLTQQTNTRQPETITKMSNTTKDRIAEHQMEYRNLGKTGLRVSVLSLGAWVTYGGQVGNEVALECMKVAYDAGVNFFDNAEGYAAGEAETVMGQVIKTAGWKRSDLVISTKIFFGARQKYGVNDRGCSRKHIIEGMNESLARLQMDYVDIVFCHRPDPLTPIEETVRAMNYL